MVINTCKCNNAFQLATQKCCVASCSDLLLVLLHLKGRLVFLVYMLLRLLREYWKRIRNTFHATNNTNCLLETVFTGHEAIR